LPKPFPERGKQFFLQSAQFGVQLLLWGGTIKVWLLLTVTVFTYCTKTRWWLLLTY